MELRAEMVERQSSNSEANDMRDRKRRQSTAYQHDAMRERGLSGANPDSIAFRNRMDDLNRYITFNEINPTIAQKLREYFYETKYTRAAEARRAIVSEMSGDLQEEVCDLVNHAWIENVPFFRGLTTPDGLQIVQPAEKALPPIVREPPPPPAASHVSIEPPRSYAAVVGLTAAAAAARLRQRQLTRTRAAVAPEPPV